MYQKILCPIDGSDTAKRGMQEALRLAADQHAAVCFLHIVDIGALIMYAPMTEEIFEVPRQRGREILQEAAQAAAAAGVSADTKLVEIMSGRAAPIIVEQAEQVHADLIAMGTHGRRGINRLLLGSDAAMVIGTTPLPVLLVK